MTYLATAGLLMLLASPAIAQISPGSAADVYDANGSRVGHYIARTSGSGPPNEARAPTLGTSSLRSSPPNVGAPCPSNVIDFLSMAIGSHLPPPYSNSKGCRCLIDVGREGGARNLCNRSPKRSLVRNRSLPGKRPPSSSWTTVGMPLTTLLDPQDELPTVQIVLVS